MGAGTGAPRLAPPLAGFIYMGGVDTHKDTQMSGGLQPACDTANGRNGRNGRMGEWANGRMGEWAEWAEWARLLNHSPRLRRARERDDNKRARSGAMRAARRTLAPPDTGTDDEETPIRQAESEACRRQAGS